MDDVKAQCRYLKYKEKYLRYQQAGGIPTRYLDLVLLMIVVKGK